ncbi:N-acetylmuramic acid 6-phosphate etherase [Alteromonas sp. ASW11-36]|uniref:N-acetylmuramic acid 6-phosphate etherase n=1 Tax=Alteromonas arenosi TaxID=3055817 RepID=A0ABT7SZA7_9ALTE|nr:N-acetylmuramic acid 6-phosphate etherase [Alteromonas sp. ASW11-36]MDM7861522.1 N-acetylmuramic acid 6-phosphate etherase [Alteromonas sp. ASW11-36]
MSNDTSALLKQLETIASEARNPATMDIDILPTKGILQCINSQDQLVALAIEKCLDDIALAVDAIVDAIQTGGRLFYIGAGTSGRLGILDAVECRPTFSVDDELVQGIIAGGSKAIEHAIEGAEDDQQAAIDDLKKRTFNSSDVLVGIAASGRTPYVISALNYASQLGAKTIGISCSPNSAVEQAASIGICAQVGPECLTGSTRMKSGTAQKLILNMLSTATMIRLGKTYQNLMVDVNASNQKLRARAQRIVMQATGCDASTAVVHLNAADQQSKLAILTVLTGLDVDAARALLATNQGFLRRAVEQHNDV